MIMDDVDRVVAPVDEVHLVLRSVGEVDLVVAAVDKIDLVLGSADEVDLILLIVDNIALIAAALDKVDSLSQPLTSSSLSPESRAEMLLRNRSSSSRRAEEFSRSYPPRRAATL